MRRIYISVLIFCHALAAIGQQQANYELAEKAVGMKLSMGFENITPFFVPESDNFWFRQETGNGEMYYFVDVYSGSVEELFDREKLAAGMHEATGKDYDPRKLNLWGTMFGKDGVTMRWRDGDILFEYDRKTGELAWQPAGKRNEDQLLVSAQADAEKIRLRSRGISPDGNYQVFGKNHNIYLRDLRDSTTTQLTYDGQAEFSYVGRGDADQEVRVVPVWFDDSENFYLSRIDLRNIGKVYNVDYINERPSAFGVENVLAGDSVVLYTEYSLFDVATKRQKKVQIDKWQDQWTRVLHDDREAGELYIERKTRRSKILEVCRIDLATGEAEVIIREEGEPYIPIELASIHFLEDSGDMIWWSERTGYGHLYRYDSRGNLKNAITSGDWIVGRVVKIDKAEGVVYFQAYGITPGENPSYAKICRANLDGKGEVTILTPEEATHSVQFTPSGKYFIDIYSRPDLPYQYELRDIEGRFITKLAEQDVTDLYASGWQLPSTFCVKAADGTTDLYGVMWKPFDFDPTRKYPVISCVYPGPQTDNVPLTFSTASENELLAQLGFIVVAFNHRGGIPYRGRDYHSFGYENIRDHALADDKCGLEQLIERYLFVDGQRVGIYGHSGGGMMSTAAICTYPDFYKACVASAGNHDNNIYTQFFVEGHYGINEQVVTVKEKGEDGQIHAREKIVYSTNLPTNMELAKNLKGHLMLIVGGMDGNVHPANTIRVVEALINHGKDFELVFLPRARHTYAGTYEWYFRHKLWSHFGKYLLGDTSASCFYDIEFDKNTNKVKRLN